jgi:hypothetical protein
MRKLLQVSHFPVSVTLTMSAGVPVYAKTTDWVPAAILWFFDSRSFVSGTGNGPGVWRSFYSSIRDYLLKNPQRTYSRCSELLLGGPGYGAELYQAPALAYDCSRS